MSSDFKISRSNVFNSIGKYSYFLGEISKYRTELYFLTNLLDSSFKEVTSKSLIKLINDLDNVIDDFSEFERVLNTIVILYENCEKSIITQFAPQDAKGKFPFWGGREGFYDFKEVNGNIPIGKVLNPLIDIALSSYAGDKINPATYVELVASKIDDVNLLYFMGKNGVKDGLLEVFGLTKYFDESIEASKSFSYYFKNSLLKEFNEFKNFETFTDGGNAVAKWAGSIVDLAYNSVENYEEFDRREITAARAIGETIIETGVDVGLGIAATSLAAGMLGAAAPVIAVGAVSAGVVIGANWISEKFFNKDLGETVADLTCDCAKGVALWFENLV